MSMIEEITEKITERLPERVKLAKVEFEGPEIVIYTKNPEIIKDNGNIIRDLAKDIRKRIIIRSNKRNLWEYNRYNWGYYGNINWNYHYWNHRNTK